MSTMRYSGEIRIRVTFIDYVPGDVYSDGTPRHPNGSYRCFLSVVGGSDATIHVNPPVCRFHAVDAAKAFDEAARAALAFADADGWPVEAHAASIESGWHVGRSPAKAWPKEKSSAV